MIKTIIIAIAASVLPAMHTPFWGFFAHKRINRLAVFTLPPEMIGFYKANIAFLEETSVKPDKRRYAVEEEGARHYFDADHYADSALTALSHGWEEAVKQYGEDSLQAHGILPWHLARMYRRLRDAFMVKDPSQILKVSAELGHYVADAHVPLHTTKNYNGQLTGQDGIHGFWESRLPELFSSDFDFFVGCAEYIDDPGQAAWQAVMSSHRLVNEVLQHERELAFKFGEKKYSYETRGATTVKVYASEYARAYHKRLDGMVERQMRASVKMTGDLWYTAWVSAGQPELRPLVDHSPSEEELQHNRDALQEWKQGVRIRNHD